MTPEMTGPIEGRAIEDYTALDVRRLLAILWRAELPIGTVMRAQREYGDDMTFADVYRLAYESGDPLAGWVDALTADIE